MTTTETAAFRQARKSMLTAEKAWKDACFAAYEFRPGTEERKAAGKVQREKLADYEAARLRFKAVGGVPHDED
jgi:hypothetical protein